MMDKTELQEQLLNWYDHSKRVLPWRDDKDPYKIWISEIMLQQTKVETVIPYFNRFIDKYPTVQLLSLAEMDELNKMWEGLGYYSRIRNISKAAKVIVKDFKGIIPNTLKELESLPGIGPYTSGAISSIAFEKKQTAVDGNVLRVFARLLRIKDDIKDKDTKKRIKNYVEGVLPDTRIGDFNQGLMEIGATVCLPNGKPLCSVCPFNDFCKAYKFKETDSIPLKQKQKAKRKEEVTVYIIKYKDKYGIEKRKEQGLLAGLYQFPNTNQSNIDLDLPKRETTKLIESKHIFTHIIWKIKANLVTLNYQIEGLTYVSKEELINDFSIPTAFKTYKELIKKDLI